jgi:hypothetical protein
MKLQKQIDVYVTRVRTLIERELSIDQRQIITSLPLQEKEEYFRTAANSSTQDNIRLVEAERAKAEEFKKLSESLRHKYEEQKQACEQERHLAAIKKLGILPAFHVRRKNNRSSPKKEIELVDEETSPEHTMDSTATSVGSGLELRPRQRVLVQWAADGYFYPARLGAKVAQGFEVVFNNGDSQVSALSQIIPIDIAMASLRPGEL